MISRRVKVSIFATAALSHFLIYTATWGRLFAAGDAGSKSPAALEFTERILGFPFMYLMLLPPSFFGPQGRWWGDDSHFIVALSVLNSLAWAAGILFVIISWRKHSLRRGT